MKKNLFRLIAVWGLAAAASPLFAQSMQGLKATVPFDFQVGSTTMPAGVYIIEPGDHFLYIRKADGDARIIQIATATEKKSKSGGSEMVFYRYGAATFLDRVIPPGTPIGFQLPKSKQQKDLAARLPQTEVSTVLVARNR